MKKLMLVAFMAYFAEAAAQNPNLDYQYAVKLYNLSTFEVQKSIREQNAGFTTREYNSSFRILQPTVAFQWKSKKKDFHEIELTTVSARRLVNRVDIMNDTTGMGMRLAGYNVFSTFISVRYEYILNLSKNTDKKWVPSLGFGFNPYFGQNRYSPATSAAFPVSDNSAGFKTFITPRVNYYISSRLFLDLNIPFCFFDWHRQANMKLNPSIPPSQQRIYRYNYSVVPGFYSLRLGIGLKI